MKQKNNHLKIVKSDFSKLDNQKSIDISIEEENTIIDFNLSLSITKHAFKRLSSRSITPNVLSLAYIHGTEYQKQGCTFYVLNRRPNLSNIKELKKNQELVVLISNDNQLVITAYWTKNANIHVKKKVKYYEIKKNKRA